MSSLFATQLTRQGATPTTTLAEWPVVATRLSAWQRLTTQLTQIDGTATIPDFASADFDSDDFDT